MVLHLLHELGHEISEIRGVKAGVFYLIYKLRCTGKVSTPYIQDMKGKAMSSSKAGKPHTV